MTVMLLDPRLVLQSIREDLDASDTSDEESEEEDEYEEGLVDYYLLLRFVKAERGPFQKMLSWAGVEELVL